MESSGEFSFVVNDIDIHQLNKKPFGSFNFFVENTL